MQWFKINKMKTSQQTQSYGTRTGLSRVNGMGASRVLTAGLRRAPYGTYTVLAPPVVLITRNLPLHQSKPVYFIGV